MGTDDDFSYSSISLSFSDSDSPPKTAPAPISLPPPALTPTAVTSPAKAAPSASGAARAATSDTSGPPSRITGPPAHVTFNASQSGVEGASEIPQAPPLRELPTQSGPISDFYLGARPASRYFLDDKTKPKTAGNLKTLDGVFIPVLQSLLGMTLFIRMPWIVGQTGIGNMIIITILSNLNTLLSTLSMSAIATNGIISGGGMYYMVSRSLGPEIGGAIGVLLFLASGVSCASCLLGFAESLVSLGVSTGIEQLDLRLWGSLALIVLTIIVLVGVKYVAKVAPFVFGLVLILILSFVIGFYVTPRPSSDERITGIRSSTFSENWGPAYDEGMSFSLSFAIFYPAVTGFQAGAAYSGDLRNAQRSIPIGTLMGVGLVALFYIFSPILVGSVAVRTLLKEDYFFLSTIAWPHAYVVKIGVLCSTFGAALQSLAGAPRLLQAIAKDGIIPPLNMFAVGTGPSKEPLRGLAILVAFAFSGVMVGSINFIAPIATMAVVLCYGCINLACLLSDVLASPGWRPSWPYYHWSVSLLGMLSSIFIMFLISWISALVCLAVAGLIYMYISYTKVKKDWGDGMTGLRYSLATWNLASLNNLPAGTKNWRPQFLLLCGYDELYRCRSENLLRFATQLRKGSGLVIAATAVEGSLDDPLTKQRVQTVAESLKALFQHKNLDGFFNVAVDQSRTTAIRQIMQQAGLGPLNPNTIVFEFPVSIPIKAESVEFLYQVVTDAAALDKAVMVVKGNFPTMETEERLLGEIHLWWLFHDGGLMVLLPTLLWKHRLWKHCPLHIWAVALHADNVARMKAELESFLVQLRIEAKVDVVVLGDAEVSNYTFQRTMKARERIKLESQLLSERGKVKKPPTLEAAILTSKDPVFGKRSPATDLNMSTILDGSLNTSSSGADDEFLDKARNLNSLIKEKSWSAQLVISNLPAPVAIQSRDSYVYSLQALLADLNRVVLVRGSGQEVVTVYN